MKLYTEKLGIKPQSFRRKARALTTAVKHCHNSKVNKCSQGFICTLWNGNVICVEPKYFLCVFEGCNKVVFTIITSGRQINVIFRVLHHHYRWNICTGGTFTLWTDFHRRQNKSCKHTVNVNLMANTKKTTTKKPLKFIWDIFTTFHDLCFNACSVLEVLLTLGVILVLILTVAPHMDFI